MNDFGNVQVFTGQEIAQSQQNQSQVQAPTVAGNVEQSRAIAEAQAAMVVARMNPRDEVSAYNKIMKACKRKSLAERATYAYKRGGQHVTGASIRLAEVLARQWGNITYGLRELNRKNGSSEMEAYAWDLETNTKVSRTFTVKHIREKKSGNVELDSERDIYELTANMGQRRVRACILELVPGDIVEAAEEQCKKTIEEGGGEPLEDRIRKMVSAFGDLGVSKEMIEDFLGHKVEAMVAQQLVRLTEIYRSIRDGIGKREDFFQVTDAPPTEQPEYDLEAFINHSSTVDHPHQTEANPESETPVEGQPPETEQTTKEPPRDNLKKIAKAFGCSSNELAELMAWYRQGERATAEEIQKVQNDFKGILEKFRSERAQEPTAYQVFDELQQQDPTGIDEAMFETGFSNEPTSADDLQKIIDKYHELTNTMK